MSERRPPKRPRGTSFDEPQEAQYNHFTKARIPAETPEASLEAAEFNFPPPSGYDIDRLNYHISLREFGRGVQAAANAVFCGAGERRSRYTNVAVILLSWEDEDPNLPVSLEIEALKDVFVNLYGFEVEEWKIPNMNSHTTLNLKILQLLDDSDSKHLKIIYYAGHGKLSTHGQAIWTSYRNSHIDRPPTVKWSGIQNALEESQSDVLVLLDCCASGLSNTDEGNGVTELLAACAFNNTTNGVGPFSFTHVLITQLRNLVNRPSFTIGYLYNLIFAQVQGLPVKSAEYRKPPIHLVLTQDHRLPRSITLSAKRPVRQVQSDLHMLMLETPFEDDYSPPIPMEAGSSPAQSLGASGLSPFSSYGDSSTTSLSQIAEYPRLLFSIRISEDIDPRTLSAELLADWLSALPMEAKSVRVEAGFASDSTLLMVSMPVGLVGYLPYNDAITLLGTTRSRNLMSTKNSSATVDPAVSTEQKMDAGNMFTEETSQSSIKEDFEEEPPDVATPRPYDTIPDISRQPTRVGSPSDLNSMTSPFLVNAWEEHLGRQESSSQLNHIYSKWSMEKLEVVAKSVAAAYRVRKHEEEMSLLIHRVESMGVSWLKSPMEFKMTERDDSGYGDYESNRSSVGK